MKHYPPIERTEELPGLADFYSQSAIEVDRAVYQSIHQLDRRTLGWTRKEGRKNLLEARKLLWKAFGRYQEICQAENLDSPEAYDQAHRLHYDSREWLGVLQELLKGTDDPRWEEVQSALAPTP